MSCVLDVFPAAGGRISGTGFFGLSSGTCADGVAAAVVSFDLLYMQDTMLLLCFCMLEGHAVIGLLLTL